MAGHLELRPGHWEVECDRCGFYYYNDQVKREWTGKLVCFDCYDPKHPQLDLKSKVDRQTVPYSRPPHEPNYLTPGNLVVTSLYVAVTGVTSTITVDSISGIVDGYVIAIQLDSNDVYRTTVNGTPSGSTVTLTDPIRVPASSGNRVDCYQGAN